MEIKYDNSKENLLGIQKRIQERKLRDKIKSKIYYMKIFHNITDYDIRTTIFKTTIIGNKYSIDFEKINDDNNIDDLNYDDLNSIYNLLEAFDEDLNKMEGK